MSDWEWGVEIHDGLYGICVVTEAGYGEFGGGPLNEETARYEFKRWQGYGYDCRRIVKRSPGGEWVDADDPDAAAKAVFEASLPTGKNGELIPGHTTWSMLGEQAHERYRRMAKAAIAAQEQ